MQSINLIPRHFLDKFNFFHDPWGASHPQMGCPNAFSMNFHDDFISQDFPWPLGTLSYTLQQNKDFHISNTIANQTIFCLFFVLFVIITAPSLQWCHILFLAPLHSDVHLADCAIVTNLRYWLTAEREEDRGLPIPGIPSAVHCTA